MKWRVAIVDDSACKLAKMSCTSVGMMKTRVAIVDEKHAFRPKSNGEDVQNGPGRMKIDQNQHFAQNRVRTAKKRSVM